MTTTPNLPPLSRLPEPDTHCFDDDTGKDVWSYSEGQVRSILASSAPTPAAAHVPDDAIVTAGHRTAWRYKHSSDPAHSSTYAFNRACLLQFARAILALRPPFPPLKDQP